MSLPPRLILCLPPAPSVQPALDMLVDFRLTVSATTIKLEMKASDGCQERGGGDGGGEQNNMSNSWEVRLHGSEPHLPNPEGQTHHPKQRKYRVYVIILLDQVNPSPAQGR